MIMEGQVSGQEQISADPSFAGQAEMQAERESSIQKLKRQRAEARQEADQYRQRFMDLESRFRDLETRVTQGTNGAHGAKSVNSWQDLSPDQLRQYATTPEFVSENPHVAINAAMLYAQKLFDEKSETLTKDIENRVFKRFQNDEARREVVGRIKGDFGAEALDGESDLFALADQKYRALQKRYVFSPEDQEKFDSHHEMKYLAVREAAEELGISPRSRQGGASGARLPSPRPNDEGSNQESDRERSVPSYVQRKPQGPPPEDRISGGSQGGHAERLAGYKSLIDKGDVKGASLALAKGLLGRRA
jgi:hypothetical protein